MQASRSPLGDTGRLRALRRRRARRTTAAWIEVISALHAAMWRGELRRDQAEPMRQRALNSPIKRTEPKGLLAESRTVADELGWAKTYDANHVALARILDCKLVTLDARLRRGAARLGFVTGPTEL